VELAVGERPFLIILGQRRHLRWSATTRRSCSIRHRPTCLAEQDDRFVSASQGASPGRSGGATPSRSGQRRWVTERSAPERQRPLWRGANGALRAHGSRRRSSSTSVPPYLTCWRLEGGGYRRDSGSSRLSGPGAWSRDLSACRQRRPDLFDEHADLQFRVLSINRGATGRRDITGWPHWLTDQSIGPPGILEGHSGVRRPKVAKAHIPGAPGFQPASPQRSGHAAWAALAGEVSDERLCAGAGRQPQERDVVRVHRVPPRRAAGRRGGNS